MNDIHTNVSEKKSPNIKSIPRKAGLSSRYRFGRLVRVEWYGYIIKIVETYLEQHFR